MAAEIYQTKPVDAIANRSRGRTGRVHFRAFAFVHSPAVLVWTDAMYEARSAVPARGGFVVVVPAEGAVPATTYISSHDTPPEVIGKFVPGKKQYIGQLELLYAVAPYTSIPHVFKNRQVIHFIDD